MSITTRHPWLPQFGEAPRPTALDGLQVDVVETNRRAGLGAVEELRDLTMPVGRLLCCLTHGAAHIPVPPGTARRWSAAHSLCHTGLRACASFSGPPKQCSKRLWLIPPGTPFLTDPQALHNQLSLSHSPRTAPERAP